MKRYGHFDNNGYKITERNTPRPWYNFLFNDEYVSSVSQIGSGISFSQDESGHRTRLVSDRAVYIFDEERCWQANGLPVQRNLQYYHCFHGIGFSDIEISHRGIRTQCRFFVPINKKREFLRVSVKNESRQTKKLTITPYYASDFEATHGDFSEEHNGVIGAGYDQNKRRYVYLNAAETVTGYDARHNAFIGPYGHKLQPAAIAENQGCTNSRCIAETVCYALENKVTLAPGESKYFYYTFGTETSMERIPRLSGGEIEEAFSVLCSNHDKQNKTLRVHTPWDDLDNLCNNWLKYQASFGSKWSKLKENITSELAINAEALSCFNPKLAAKRLLQLLSIQNENGYLPHSFDRNSPIDCLCAESTIRPIFAAYAITKELGNVDFLMQKAPFRNGNCVTVYEHLKQAIAYLWKSTGHMGLIKTQYDLGAPQNDKYVNVWLSIAYVKAAKMLSEMANWIGSSADSRAAAHYAQEMEKRVNTYTWSESRYLYAFAENKHLIGARSCPEGSVFALPQIWSVLAEFDPERTHAAMDTLEIELNTDLGLLSFSPAFSETYKHINGIGKIPAGTQNNASVDLSASTWKIAADCLLQRNDKIDEGLRKILPLHHEFYETKGEPYVLYDSYFSENNDYRAGDASDSWNSAVGSTLLYVLNKYVYGLYPEFGGLMIKPCLPNSWKDCSISKIFRGCRYNIHFIQKDAGNCNTIESIYVNGTEINPNLPIRPQPEKTLNIEVILRS